MTFSVVVTYQIHNGTVMSREITGVKKIDLSCDENGVEAIRVYVGSPKWSTWVFGAVLNIDIIPS